MKRILLLVGLSLINLSLMLTQSLAINIDAAPDFRATCDEGCSPNPSLFHLALVPNLNSDDVSILDTHTQQEVIRIPVGPRPYLVAMRKDGNYSYVATIESGNTAIYKINLNSLIWESTIYVPVQHGTSTSLRDLEISPNDRWLVVADKYKGTISIVDTLTDTIESTFSLCTECGISKPLYSSNSIDFSPDSQFAYISDARSQSLFIVELLTQEIVGSLPLQYTGGWPITDMEITSDGNFLYTSTNFCPNQVCSIREYDLILQTFQDYTISSSNRIIPDFELVLNQTKIASGNSCYGCGDVLDVFDLEKQEVSSIPSSTAIRNLIYVPETSQLWGWCEDVGLAHCEGGLIGDTISVFDMLTMERIQTIFVDLSTGGFIPNFSQDKNFYYAANNQGDEIIVINATTYSVSNIPVGDNPRGIFMQGDNSTKENY